MVQSSEISEIIPPAGLEGFLRGRSPKLWAVGNRAILNRPLLAILSARHFHSELASISALLLKQLASLEEISFVGGWHSPLERDALSHLLNQQASLVFCVSKALDRFVPSRELERRLSEGKTLLLTHCGPKAKRMSRMASIRRNGLIIALAKALVVLSAPVGSMTLKLAQSALSHQKPVLTLDHPMNESLIANGALPTTAENIQIALR